MMQRVPYRQRSTPSQSKPMINCFSGEGYRNSEGSWDSWVTIWIDAGDRSASGGLPPVNIWEHPANIWNTEEATSWIPG